MIRMLAAIGFGSALCACSQTPAKIADLSPERLATVDDTALCDAVNSSTRSAEVVAEVKRRMIPCDSIATWCLQQGHEDGSEPFRGCVAQIEQRWRDQREAVEKQRMHREMMRQGDPMRSMRDRQMRTVCRVENGPDGSPRQVCTTQ